jgi:lysophospholipase L1-like esterase
VADRGPRHPVFARLALILVGAIIAAVLTELALRTVFTIPEVANPLYSFHESDPVLGWRGKRDWTARFRRPEFDALIAHGPDGWRSPDPPPAANPTRRVLFLGDSFTWGWGVSQGELFSDDVQRRLPVDVAVYNRGINGFGTSQEYLLMQRELAERHYDAVALMFFHNDVGDNVNPKRGRRPLFALDGDRLVPRNQPPRALMNPVARFFKDHSRAYQTLDVEISMLVRSIDDDDETPTIDPTDVDYQHLPGAAVTMRLLAEMNTLAAAHGAKFFLIYLPHVSEIRARQSIYPYIRAVHAMIRDVAAREKIPLIDLSEPFYTHMQQGEALVFAHDEHWTRAGHAVAADVLLQSPLFDFSPPRHQDTNPDHD